MVRASKILGLNAYHGDASACLVVDGDLVAAVEEERFTRVKHQAGFPARAARFCLEAGGVRPEDLDVVAINRRPAQGALRKVAHVLRSLPSWSQVKDRLRNHRRVHAVEDELGTALGVRRGALRARVVRVDHHRAHLASAFLVSPFDDAAVLSVDGFGDFASCAWGVGEGARITEHARVHFPHSLGTFYLALTQYLGFPSYGDEYKVMGLAAYGQPTELDALRHVLRLLPEGRFELGLAYFRHASEGIEMEWSAERPEVGRSYTAALEELLGPARRPGQEITTRHENVAASVQAAYEEALFHVLGEVARTTGKRRLCLAGGCAMNSVANGKIRSRTTFDDLWVQPAAGDAGGALGAAFHVWNELGGGERRFTMTHARHGPGFGDDEIADALIARSVELEARGCRVEVSADEDQLCRRVAGRIAEGAVVGWFQGRMEWGARALGARSILADPRRADMRAVLNDKIKRRESFRPFAPAVLREAAEDWFEGATDVPFMLEVLPVATEKRASVPAITHVDGTGRLQTVTRESDPRFHRLITAFECITGVPMLLNTSFNENEPIACRPEEALDCFLRTRMDALVLGDLLIVATPLEARSPEEIPAALPSGASEPTRLPAHRLPPT